MVNSDLKDYKNLYLQTAREHLRDLKKNLNLLNQNPSDPDLIYEIFRLFHSLKSQNYFMGFTATGNFCKLFETFFRNIKNRTAIYHPAISNILTEALNLFEKALNEIEKSDHETDLAAAVSSYSHRLGLT